MNVSGVRRWVRMACAAVACLALAGCEGSGDGGGSASVDVNGFWEGTTPNGSTCAATFVQDGSSVTGPEVKINRFGSLKGSLSGQSFTFTMNYADGDTESGTGTFSADGMKFEGQLPSVGDFYFLWRGPSFAEHSPLDAPLTYSK